MSERADHPALRIRTHRVITGMSAVLLPFTTEGAIDRDGFVAHLHRTASVGLVPAVNMDTGYGALLGPDGRRAVLELTASELADEFVAGTYVDDAPGAALDVDGYRRATDEIVALGGTPILFPSFGLAAAAESELVALHGQVGEGCERFLAFELGEMFAGCGRIFSLDAYRAILEIATCVGAKHSSLDRRAEWARLALRDEVRPEFMVLSGNDLAIDMVIYGSDYLLGLSTFAPEAFARRDAYWASGDPRFYELNDVLQYLGQIAFRPPVPGYKHDAAMFLHDRGLIGASMTHPASPMRPASDRALMRHVAERLDELVAG